MMELGVVVGAAGRSGSGVSRNDKNIAYLY